ncbi:MAG: CaiB/BaiF CoA-transferase family protein, partial [Pseudomonadota bacterium]
PLEGLKVVEMAGLGPCPLAGQFLADLGAEVTLIARRSAPADRGPDPTDVNNRGKRSVALNLKSEAGVEAALRLIERADILIEGFRPGVMERIGLGPDACAARNPSLVFGRMTGWGQEGPLSQTAGHDINYLAITGVLNAVGKKDAPPIPPLNIAADYAGGTMFLLLGVLSALWERSRSGRGQVVDAAMVDGAPALMALIHGFLGKGMWSTARESNLLDGGAPFYRCYETADGKHVSVGALEPQFFAELVDKAGLPEDHKARQMDAADWPVRHEAYAAVFAAKTRDEWTAIFEGSDACVAPVMDWTEAPAHPHMAARGTLIDVAGVTQAAPAPRFDRTPAATPTPAAPPGSDTEATLAELGYSMSDIEDMRAQGALT